MAPLESAKRNEILDPEYATDGQCCARPPGLLVDAALWSNRSMNKFLTAIVVICTAAALQVAAQKNETKVELVNGQGQSVGTATLSPAKDGGVAVALDLKNLTPGRHAIHFHMTPKCEGPAFTSAGGHYNPDSKKHGLLNPEGPHAGDMPNFTVKPIKP